MHRRFFKSVIIVRSGLLAAGFLLIIFGLFIHFQKAEAAVPKYLNFQTKLTKNSDGTNVADGNYSMQFKIYDALTSGNLLWTETWDGTAGTAQVQVANGVASVKLGTYTNLSTVDFTGGTLYLTLNFNPGAGYDGEMLPRKQLLSAAFAFNANNLVGDGRIAIIATSTTQSAMQITYNPDSSTSTPAAIITASSNVTGPALKVVQNGSGPAALFSGGNVGIGSTSPTALLAIQGTSGSATDLFNVTSSTNASLFKVASNGSTTVSSLTAGIVQSTSNGNLYISPVALGTQTSGVLAVSNGGTGTSTLPTVTGQLLMADGTGVKYQAGNLVAGANITITTTTPGSITIAATGGSANPVGSNTQLQYNNGGAFGGANLFYINGYEFGINSTTPTANLVVQGSSTNPTLPVFTVSSSSNASFLTVAANGSTTISSLNSAGTVQTTASGALYVSGNTGSGLNVMQTSPTLVTPILGVASGTALTLSNNLWITGTASTSGQTTMTSASSTSFSVSGILWGNGQTNLTTASATALSVSGLSYLASTSLTGIFSVSGSTTLSSLTSAGLVRTTSSGALYVDPQTYLTSAVTTITCSGSILPCTGTTPTIQLQNLTTNDILFGAGTNTFATSSSFTYTTGNNLLTVSNASTTVLTSGTLFVTGQTTLANASSTALSVSGLSYLASSTVTGTLSVTGSTTLSSLTSAGTVQTTSGGALFVTGNTGTGLTVMQTSPTLVTPVLGVASGTALTLSNNLWITGTASTSGQTTMTSASSTSFSVSGILWGNGQTNLTTASATALSVSGLSFFASSSVSGTFSATGSTTLSSLTSAGPVYTTSGGALYVGANVGGGTPCTTTGYSIQYNNNGSFGCVSRLITDGGLIGYNATSSTASFNIQGTSGSANTIFNVASSTGIAIFNVTANQRVGIGSSTPNATLAVQGTSTSPTLDVLQVASSSNAILFNVTAAGNVGIGISAPAAALHVFGTGIIQSSTNTTTAFQVQNANGAAILLVDTTPTYGATTTNYVVNPGFEVNTTGWVASSTAAIARVATNKYHGLASLKIDDYGAVAGQGATTNSFSPAPGAGTYVLSFYARTDISSSTFSTLMAGYATSSAFSACSLNSNIVSNLGWNRYSCNFTVSGAITNIFIGQSDTGSRTFYVDAVQLQLGTLATPYSIGSIQLRGVITSPVAIMPVSNSVSAFQIQDISGTSNLFVVNTLNGRIGIGTTTPSIRLAIQSASSTMDILDVASTSAASFMRVTFNGRVGFGSSTPSAVHVVQGLPTLPTTDILRVASSSNAVFLTVTSAGRVGINTTSPIATLAIQTQAGVNAFTVASSTGATTTYFTITDIGRVGVGTSSPAARFSVAANCFNFASTTPAKSTGLCTDYAEIYPSSEPVDMADIVSSGRAADAVNPAGLIKKSVKSYDGGILGVVSTNPAVVVEGNSVELMNGADYHHNPLSPAIALAGRVPVKIKADQVISVGDFITSSDVPGVGMKAERSGEVIGQALENFDPAAKASGKPTVLVFIHPGYQVIGQALELSELMLSQGLDFSSPRMTSQEILQKLLAVSYATSSNLSFITADRLVAGLDIITPQLTAKSLNVGEIQPSLDNSGITIGGEVYFIGRPYFTSDTAGFAVVNSGDSAVDVTFDKPYLEQPIVNASISANATSTAGALDQFAQSVFDNGIQFIITNKSEQGFTILLNKPAPTGIQFSWIALAVRGAKIFSSKVSINDVAVSGPSGTAVSVPTPVVATTTASSSPVIIPADPRVLGASTTPLSETGAVPADADAGVGLLSQTAKATTSTTVLSGDSQPSAPLSANIGSPLADPSPAQDQPLAPETP